MRSNLNCSQLKIDCYIHRIIYVNPLVTINQKTTIDTQKLEKQEHKHTTKGSHQIIREEKKEGKTENYKKPRSINR